MLLLVLDLDTVRIAFIPLIENNSIRKVSNVTLNLIPNLEMKLIELDACLETIPKPVVIQVLPNKDKDTLTFIFRFGPLDIGEISTEEHGAHTLENVFFPLLP